MLSQKYRRELLLTLVLFLVLAGLLVWGQVLDNDFSWGELLEKLAFALIVSIAVRTLAILFDACEETDDRYATTKTDLIHALENAKKRIWICQTWLPGVGGDAKILLDRRVDDTRLLLSSFKDEALLRARIAARPESLEQAKNNSAGSTSEFVMSGRQDCVRFNPIHHPGWIAVIDSQVFWGFTPVDRDNWSEPRAMHRARKTDERAKFWIEQFELLWEGKHPDTHEEWSHEYKDECPFNGKLRKPA